VQYLVAVGARRMVAEGFGAALNVLRQSCDLCGRSLLVRGVYVYRAVFVRGTYVLLM